MSTGGPRSDQGVCPLTHAPQPCCDLDLAGRRTAASRTDPPLCVQRGEGRMSEDTLSCLGARDVLRERFGEEEAEGVRGRGLKTGRAGAEQGLKEGEGGALCLFRAEPANRGSVSAKAPGGLSFPQGGGRGGVRESGRTGSHQGTWALERLCWDFGFPCMRPGKPEKVSRNAAQLMFLKDSLQEW